MSSRTILSRPRTRIYGSNYNIGESYYKSALDRLDRKYSGRPLSPPRQSSPGFDNIAERHPNLFPDDDLESSRRRGKDVSLFDSRGAKIGFRASGSDFLENEGISDETAATLKRIRASKRVALVDDVDMESTSSNLRTQRMLDRSEKILDSIGIGSETSARRAALEDDFSFKTRAIKVSHDADAENLTKWSALPEEKEVVSSAAIRARQSRAKIDDIDEEVAAMQEKQAARERRVARLKALVAECDAETVDDSGVATTVTITEKKVRF